MAGTFCNQPPSRKGWEAEGPSPPPPKRWYLSTIAYQKTLIFTQRCNFEFRRTPDSYSESPDSKYPSTFRLVWRLSRFLQSFQTKSVVVLQSGPHHAPISLLTNQPWGLWGLWGLSYWHRHNDCKYVAHITETRYVCFSWARHDKFSGCGLARRPTQ
jgi:hypothetical protein